MMASVVTPVVTPVVTSVVAPVVTPVVTSAEAAGQGLGGGEGKGESQQEKQGEEPHLQQTRKQSGRGDEAEGRVASRAAVRTSAVVVICYTVHPQITPGGNTIIEISFLTSDISHRQIK